MNKDFIINLSKIGSKDIDLVGGKAASLGELINAQLPVPHGFVITTECYRKFRNQELPIDVKEKIFKAFDELGAERVAVRSSAIGEDSLGASWAGQFETYLNTSKENLIEAIRKCWESIHSERALSYAAEKNINEDELAIGVVVQKMVDSEVSGVMFTVNPINNDKNELMIEAGYGLGESLVQGLIVPDNFLVNKKTLKILESHIETQEAMTIFYGGENKQIPVPKEKRNKSTLTPAQITELARLGLMIEKHYSTPQDIEWAIKKDKVYILQSRPITTLNDKKKSVKIFNNNDYMLALWFQGVSVFVTDIHNDLYKRLEALFIIDNGMFKQYFTKKAHERALDEGVKFYSDPQAFEDYKKNLSQHIDNFKKFFEFEIKDRKILSKEIVEKFFAYTRKLSGDYTKMNFEFTDKAFTLQEQNPIIKKNLASVGNFKDKVRDFMNMVLFEPDGYSYQFFKILEKQFSLPLSIFDNLTQKEMLALFANKRPDKKIVSKRQEAFVESYDFDGLYEGTDAELILQEFREEVMYSNIIHGQIASKGKIRGKVKIISVDYSDLKQINVEIKKMKQGDILVAETTAPELISACKKAGAIITDMGGLMSHAAIVSREFGIPCIVGTKNATKLLRNGDFVKVDADIGVIRILKQQKKKV